MATWVSPQPLRGPWGVIVARAGDPIPPAVATDAFLRGAVNQVHLTPDEHRRIYGDPAHGHVEQPPTPAINPLPREDGEEGRAE